jgi:ribose transport system ATP-binding protein
MDGRMPLLSLKSVSKAYNGVKALKGVSLDIGAGEIHALMGENGAGKSTLIKILAGVVAPDTAEIRVDDQLVTIDGAAGAHRLGFRFIHQEMNVVPALSVAENISLARSYPTRAGLIDWRALNASGRTALERLGISHIDPRQKMARLSLGDQMLVRISAAFLSAQGKPARLYVLDEPTAALTKEESERLFRVLEEIRSSGQSVIYVSHRLDEVMALCDRGTVLRDGVNIDTGRIAEITHDDLVAMMIGRKAQEAYPSASMAASDRVAFRMEGVTGGGAGPVSLELRAGEILGIAGLSGMGQRALLRMAFGDLATRSGKMELDGAPYHPRSPADAWRLGLAYVPAERRAEGLVLTRPIFENMTLARLKAMSGAGIWLRPRAERALAGQLGADVKLKARAVTQRVKELSGGNQQKVVFARALSTNPRVLLLDEPTRGVDVGAKFDIYTLIREMTARGMAVILVSSDLPELLGMADSIAIVREGRITTTVSAQGLGEDALINLCYGRTTSEAA